MSEQELEIPERIPVIAVRDIVIFPHMVVPLFIKREKSQKALNESLSSHRKILLLTQKDPEKEDPAPEDLYRVGTVAIISKMITLPDGTQRVLFQGLSRAKVKDIKTEGEFIEADIEVVEESIGEHSEVEIEALKRSLKESLQKTVELGKNLPPDFLIFVSNIEDPAKLTDIIAANLGIKTEEAQKLLETLDPVERMKKVLDVIGKEIQLLEVQKKIMDETKERMEKMQREFFLRQQLQSIQKELGIGSELSEEIKEYREKLAQIKNMPKEARDEVEKQISRLEKIPSESAEAGVIRTYIDWMLSLPWDKSTRDNLDIKRAKRILDKDHYDLEKVKERILEYLSVRKLAKKIKGPILCFVGPPGVGKTSLGKSIARALGRKFVRISLGGVHDEAEIRGHRRTYVGALPGRIIQGIKQAGSNNPVFMLDEVDKIGADFRGDPSSALLEVLDPEQNFAFVDHYLGVPFDLSKVMFITTANVTHTIHPAFLDRMEIIYLPGYTEEEKVHIAKKFLIPKQMKENGIKPGMIQISDDALRRIISEYTREAGVRNLERQIASIMRKVARRWAEGKKKKVRITARNVQKFLGPPLIFKDEPLPEPRVGIATGVAWTPIGGSLLFVESTKMPGKGDIRLTGSLGEVLKESAIAALSFIKSRAEDFGIDPKIFSKVDVHIHIPQGAIPKDGPSAGVAILTSLVSLFTGRPVRNDVAMTGEITLSGNVLPIGGLKEKILAAKRSKIHSFVLPRKNMQEVEDLPGYVKEKMHLIPVDRVDEVLNVALLDEKRKGNNRKS